MSTPPTPPPMDAQLELVLRDIKKHACHILHVIEEDGLPPFSYSVGINRTLRAPDAAVIGLKKETAHALINHYRDQLIAGKRYRDNDRSEGYIEGSHVHFRTIDPSNYQEWFPWNVALYRTRDFPMLQIVYPGTDGSWPWERQVSEWFRTWQPLLDKPAA